MTARSHWRRTTLHGAAVMASFSVLYVLFFSPVLFSDRLLAPSDGLNRYLPNFSPNLSLWTDLLFGGFPIAADPQAQSWYPLVRLLVLLPGSWNVLVLSAFVLASSFTYGYVHALTHSRLAAVVGGLTFGMSGYMIAHLGHTDIIHGAAWLPLMIWSVHELRSSQRALWIVPGAAAVGMLALSGHPQIVVYGLGLTAAYALVLVASDGAPRARYVGRVTTVFVSGLGLAAIQLIPTFELSSLGELRRPDFAWFTSVAMPVRQTVGLLFPYAFGGHPASPYRTEYFGQPNLSEFTGYVGLLTLLLAMPGLFANRRRPLAWFWVAVAVLAVCLAWGAGTPLARLAFHVPAYNRFRVLPRHFLEWSLALSVLSGLGVAALLRSGNDRQVIRRVLFVGAGLLALVLAGLVAAMWDSQLSDHLRASVQSERFLTHPAVFVPLLVFLGSAAVLILWTAQPARGWRQAVLIAFLVIDLGSFGWVFDWRYAAPEPQILTPTSQVERYRERLEETGQRLLNARGATSSLAEFRVNVSRVWGIRNASGYNPLILLRVRDFYPMNRYGAVFEPWAADENRALDLMGVRYVALPGPKAPRRPGKYAEPADVERFPARWSKVERIGDEAIVYENRRALPQAWTVAEVVRADPRTVLQTIHTSVMPDGSVYDPKNVALAERDFPHERQGFDPEATATLIRRRPMRLDFTTRSPRHGFLVLSDVYYPGWEASVDGQRVLVFRVNYIQRGIVLPPGEHEVRFEFKPMSFVVGVAVSSASAVLLVGILIGAGRAGNRRVSRTANPRPAPDIVGDQPATGGEAATR